MDLPPLDIGQTITHVLSKRTSVVVPRPEDASPKISLTAVWITSPFTEGPTSRGVHGLLAAYSWEGWDNSTLQDCPHCSGKGYLTGYTKRGEATTNACLRPCTLGKILPPHWAHSPLTLKSGVPDGNL